MTLINTDGLALIGPGSEWFWSMLQFVIVAITLLAIYSQVRLQASAAAIDQIDRVSREWESESLNRDRLAVLTALHDRTDPFVEATAATASVAGFFERLGFLVRWGHVDETLVNEYLGNSVQNFWAYLQPTLLTMRRAGQDEKIYEHFEWLTGRIATKEGGPGAVAAMTDEDRIRGIASGIEFCRQGIRSAEELRTMIIRDSRRRAPAK